MVLSCDDLTGDELIAKLRSCFSYAPTMNEAREELRNMRQLEHKSISVYPYRLGRALYRSSESALKMRGTPKSSKTLFHH